MLDDKNLKIVSGSWDDLAQDARVIREAVFIQEQQIAPEDEWDAEDTISTHFVAYYRIKPWRLHAY